MAIAISDGQPIQYWLNGKPTHNQKQYAYVDKRCFNQIFKCGSPINSQLTDTDLAKEYGLQIFDSENNGLLTVPFIKSYLNGGAALQFQNQAFDTDIATWQNFPGSNRAAAQTPSFAWALNGSDGIAIASQNFFPVPEPNATLTKYFATARAGAFPWPKGHYRIELALSNVTLHAPGEPLEIRPVGMPDSTHQTYLTVDPIEAVPNDGDQHSVVIEFDTDQPWAYLGFGFQSASDYGIAVRIHSATILESPGEETLAVHNASFVPNLVVPDLCETRFWTQIVDTAFPLVPIAYSDLLFSTSSIVDGPFTGAIEIKYRSNFNFDDLVYDENSPYNYLYIEARFFHEDEPIKQKVVEQADDDVVVTSTELKITRMLTVGDCPDYLHRKIKLALQHAATGDVEIDGESWVMETYGKKKRPAEEYPFKYAEALLTNRKYLKRNLI